jgi:hypothetical protein
VMDEHTIPQLIELPFASDSEHDEIIYWYADEKFPDAKGEARSVHLHKDSETIEFEVWEPAHIWQPGSGLKPRINIRPADEDLAALKAYEDLTDVRRESRKEVTIHIRMQGYPSGVRVVMKRGLYKCEQPCWRDPEGRIW